jgi:hypothetical protein
LDGEGATLPMGGYKSTHGQGAISECRRRYPQDIIDRDVDCGSGHGDPNGRGGSKDFFRMFVRNLIGVDGRLDLREEMRRRLRRKKMGTRQQFDGRMVADLESDYEGLGDVEDHVGYVDLVHCYGLLE